MSIDDDIEAYFKGELDPTKLQNLESQLKEDPEKRKDFVRESYMRSQLRRHFRAQSNLHQYHSEKPEVSPIIYYAFAALVSLSLGLASIMFYLFTQTTSSEFALAKCMNIQGKVKLNGDVLKVNDVVTTGELIVSEGSTTIMFSHGSEIFIQAPARVIIEHEQLIKLKQGNLAARISDQGHGFTVMGPDTAIIDLGTEFAVSVVDEKSWVEVYDGEIEVALLDQKGRAFKNRTFQVDGPIEIDGKKGLFKESTVEKSMVQFPEMPLEGLVVGHAYENMIMEDNPTFYLNFENGFKHDQVKNKKIESISANGKIVNNLQAIHFPRGKSHHGFYTIDHLNTDLFNNDFTLEFWMNPAFSQHRVLCEVLLNDYERHAHSKLFKLSILPQLSKSFYPEGSLRLRHELWPIGEKGQLNTFSNDTYRVNTWHHIAIVREENNMTLYMNGSSSETIQLNPSELPDQPCRLIFGALINKNKDGNHFKGLMDEISFFPRALSSKRIQEHFNSLQLN